jgi:hypothetical protein
MTEISPAAPGNDEGSRRARLADEERSVANSEKPLPLSGLRVIDVDIFLKGPYAGSILGNHRGAPSPGG